MAEQGRQGEIRFLGDIDTGSETMTYRYPTRVSCPLEVWQGGLSEIVRAIAWKAQVRLCSRYWHRMASGKRQTLVTTMIALEMAALVWTIGREGEPRLAA